MSRCRSCDAPVLWAFTEPTELRDGGPVALDADPADPRSALQVVGGNVAFTGEVNRVGAPIVRYEKDAPHRAHFVTCPDRAKPREAIR